MTLRYGIGSLALLLLLSACDEGSDTEGEDAGAGMIEAPVLTSPIADDAVSGVIAISGRGEPDARIATSVVGGATELGESIGTADATGAFSFSLSYIGASDTNPLTLSVTQSAREMTSDVVTVALVHSTPFTLSGTISQDDGSTTSEDVYVLAYLSDSVADIINPVAKAMVPAVADELVDDVAYSLPVAAGTYYLRAFRDENGDGQPSIETDPQIAATEVTISDNVADQELTLTFVADRAKYSEPSAVATRESALPFPPFGNEENPGLCGGFYLQLVTAERSSENRSGMFAKIPAGDVVQLLDDGGCGRDGDNTSSSYDNAAGNGVWSYGIADPTPQDAGDYAFFYQENDGGFVNVAVDEVPAIVDLSQSRFQSSPSPRSPTTSLRPEFVWSPVPGANRYGVLTLAPGVSAATEFVTEPTYTPTSDLVDDRCYRTSISATAFETMDGELSDNSTAFSPGNGETFCIDVDQDSSITISGAILNNTGKTGPLYVRARVGDHQVATTIPEPLPATYTLHVLADSADIEVEAFLDVDGSANGATPGNRGTQIGVFVSDGMSDQTGVDLVLNPAPVLLSPASDSEASSLTPAFSWEDYATTAGANAPADFVVAWFVNGPDDDLPGTIFALPKSATSMDLSSPPSLSQAIDIVYYFNCVNDPAEPTNDYALSAAGVPSCTNGGAAVTPDPTASSTVLTSSVQYEWGIAVFECSFPNMEVQAEVDTFLQCIGPKLGDGGFFSLSQQPLLAPAS